ncbi:MAG: MBL fold metallo-hydrolase, partial [Candidatus Acidiferrales bacterium]
GIIVGGRATLVVDTGMGPQSGEIVAREVQRLANNPIIYLVTTHSHPEHITGEQAFPPNTVWIMPVAQKEDMDENALKFIQAFSQRSPQRKALLRDVHLRAPDIVFDREAKIDLGGVTARLLWFGAAHTRGDTLILIEEDGVLLPGDIVQNKMFPIMPDDTADPAGWLAILDKVDALHPKLIVPDHGDAVGDASLIGKERNLLLFMQSRTHDLKSQGKSADEVVQILGAELKAKYPDFINPNAIEGGIRRFYAQQ